MCRPYIYKQVYDYNVQNIENAPEVDNIYEMAQWKTNAF